MGRFAVNPDKEADLLGRMVRVGLREQDLRERFLRGSGPGGQHRNKTSTCVYLKHLPSGIEVSACDNRSQSVNRFLARRELVQRLEVAQGIITPKRSRLDRARKQKQRRARKRKAKKRDEPIDVTEL